MPKTNQQKCYVCGADGLNYEDKTVGDLPLCVKHYNHLRNFNIDRRMSKRIRGVLTGGVIKSKRTFGVELECLNDFWAKFCLGLSLVPKEWGLKGDSSIKGNYTREIITCPLRGKKGEKMLTDGCNILNSLDWKSGNQYGCGSHCHIGIPEAINKCTPQKEARTEARLKLLAIFYTVFDPAIYCLIDLNRRLSSFCQPLADKLVPIDKDTKKTFGKFKEQDRFDAAIAPNSYGKNEIRMYKKKSNYYGGGRYGINFGSIYYRGTLEIRYHEGTLDPVRLIHWIALHTAIVDTVMNGEITEQEILKYLDIKIVEELKDEMMLLLQPKLNQETTDYTNRRFNEYKYSNPKDGYIGTNYRNIPVATTRPLHPMAEFDEANYLED